MKVIRMRICFNQCHGIKVNVCIADVLSVECSAAGAMSKRKRREKMENSVLVLHLVIQLFKQGNIS